MKRHLSTGLGALLSLTLGCGGCASDDTKADKPDSGPSCTLTLGFGYRDASGGFVLFQDGDDAELTLGFQGFRYIQSVLELGDVSATSAQHSARIIVEGQEPYTLSDTPVKLHDEGGKLRSDEVLVFFNDLPVVDIIGKSTEITLTAKAGGCIGSTKTVVTLRDDDQCIQQEDGGLSCGAADGGP
ncbi:MAG: hypothetical protein IPI67_32770 [Myxococcales bacterium]|nr:hypothetical protein [Myxococcales bacterium]